MHAKLLPGGTRRDALLQELSGTHYDLLVVGLSRRPGAQLFLGNLWLHRRSSAQTPPCCSWGGARAS